MPEAVDASMREWMEATRSLLAVASSSSPFDPIWDAFWRLGDERPYVVQGAAQPLGVTIITSAPRPIPWSAVAHWCAVHNLDLDIADRCIQSMDAIYLKDWAAKNVPRSATHH